MNDKEAFQNVGLSIAFNSKKPELLKYANVIIDSPDISKIFSVLCVNK